MSAALVLSDLPQLIATPSEKLRKQEANFFFSKGFSDGLSYSTSKKQKNKGNAISPTAF